MTELTADEIATRSAAAMWANDDASKHLGLTIKSVTPGQAVLSMQVESHHTNGHDICHGGYIFTLADSAFAYACNSYNQVTVAQQNSITFVAPGKLGDTLTATTTEVSRSARSGVYDAVVTNQLNETIALFRGNSRTLNRTVFNEETP
ncbi:phenylacetic acid degradation protein PaaD [Chromatiales bacterium (ex Bugula neritina AB1)]|nr:phenylacetic acid degradation protein PaaD [Chromatiales bacterium (ex Bugula neritina AB1)]